MEYWFAVAGRRFGPHSPAEFDWLLRTGQIPANAWVYPPDASRWVTVSEAVTQYPPVPAAVGPAGSWPPPQPWIAATPMAAPQPTPLNTMAVVCFVLALVSIPTAVVLVGFAFAVAAVVLGHLSIREVRRSGDRGEPQRGHGLAVAGLVIGYGMVAFCVLLLVAISVPSSGPDRQPSPSGSDSAVQTDLKNAAMAQEVVFTDTQEYTQSIGVLRANGFAPTSGADFVVTAGPDTYCVSAFRAGQATYHYDSTSGLGSGPCDEQLL